MRLQEHNRTRGFVPLLENYYYRKKFSDFFASQSGMIEPTCGAINKWRKFGKNVKIIRCDDAGENVLWRKGLKALIERGTLILSILAPIYLRATIWQRWHSTLLQIVGGLSCIEHMSHLTTDMPSGVRYSRHQLFLMDW
jgi:hypothetical protein